MPFSANMHVDAHFAGFACKPEETRLPLLLADNVQDLSATVESNSTEFHEEAEQFVNPSLFDMVEQCEPQHLVVVEEPPEMKATRLAVQLHQIVALSDRQCNVHRHRAVVAVMHRRGCSDDGCKGCSGAARRARGEDV